MYFVDKSSVFHYSSAKVFLFSNKRKFNVVHLIYCFRGASQIYLWSVEKKEIPQIMKTNFYILIIALLSFSAITAQTETKVKNVETKITVSEEKETKVILEEVKINEVIARSSSDIRIYLNRERKVDNIKLVFPKINKRKLA